MKDRVRRPEPVRAAFAQRWWTELRTPLLFAAVFTALSMAYTMTSWGRAPVMPIRSVPISAPLLAHMIAHATVGGLVALPSGRPKLILAGALGAVLIDVDHVGQFLGLPLIARASHSVGFMVAAGTLMALLTGSRYLRLDLAPLLAGATATAVVLAHMAVDAGSREAHMPLWLPFSADPVRIQSWLSFAYASGAGLLVWTASMWGARKAQRARRRA